MWGYGPGWGVMDGWGGWGWFGPLHMFVWLLVLVIVIAGLAWLLRGPAQQSLLQGPGRRSPGLDVLEERYARGEINRDEYLQKRRDILG